MTVGFLRRYWVFPAAVAGVGLIALALVEAAGPSLLTEPSVHLDDASRPAAALLGVALLTIDIVLPIPSSLVMVSHGALFGVAIGTLLSLIGSLGCFALGFAAGRRSTPLLRRWIVEEDRARAERFLARWGLLAIVLSRPVPLLAETVSIVAGASRMRLSRSAAAALAGVVPVAFFYALAGATAAAFASTALIFAVLLACSAIVALLRRRRLG